MAELEDEASAARPPAASADVWLSLEDPLPLVYSAKALGLRSADSFFVRTGKQSFSMMTFESQSKKGIRTNSDQKEVLVEVEGEKKLESATDVGPEVFGTLHLGAESAFMSQRYSWKSAVF